ncbi:uncharacterized protein LOC106457808 [Limulus polyphemus]|uniref:Uncharacterized protein LOC106457808 n=1 Tax=Limulus polyphemus TaxID=6850 RepID=A0ABM1B190_LIMPO|nr:uncharacterized protein LOC106457808 [Limulus polyphemus]
MTQGTSLVMLLCTCMAVVCGEVAKQKDGPENAESIKSTDMNLLPIAETKYSASRPVKRFENVSPIFFTDLLQALAEASKRNHQRVNFGRRATENSGHQLLHFGKRDGSRYFGQDLTDTTSTNNYVKRDQASDHIGLSKNPRYEPGLILHFLLDQVENFPYQRLTREGLKRSNDHNIMSFGKRSGQKNNPFSPVLEVLGDRLISSPNTDLKSFIKRTNDHNIMSFGKRFPEDYGTREDSKHNGHKTLYFGKKSEENRGNGHTILYFGKKSDDANNDGDNKMFSFGKKAGAEEKSGGHRILYFGKRPSVEEPAKGHQFMYFGKRFLNDVFFHPDGLTTMKDLASPTEQDQFEKKAHSIIHFGKRPVSSIILPRSGKIANEPETNDENSSLYQPLELFLADDVNDKKAVVFQDHAGEKEHRQKRGANPTEISNQLLLNRFSPIPFPFYVSHSFALPSDSSVEADLVEDRFPENYPSLLASPESYYHRQDRDFRIPTQREINKNMFLHFG